MDFQQEYIDEVRRLLKDLEHSLMVLEKKQNDAEEINNVYRYLHTLKGSAGMFGFDQVERLTHELEYVYSDIRDGIRVQDDFILDLTLHAVDVLADVMNGNDASKEISKMVTTIQEIRNASGDDSDDTSENASNGKRTAYAVFFRPEPTIFNRGVNLQAILSDLEEVGVHEVIVHNETTPFEVQLSTKKLESWFEILMVTDKGEDSIREVFMFMKPTEYFFEKISGYHSFFSEAYKSHVDLTEDAAGERFVKLGEWMPELLAVESNVQDESSESSEVKAEDEENGEIVIKRNRKATQVTVSTPKLDQLIDIVSELVTFRSEIQHLLRDEQKTEVIEAMEKLERLTLRLRDSAFNIRLVPLNILNVKLQRLIRSLSKDLSKEVEFITEGMDTELDRGMINSLEAPLMHLIRNAIDHGIESPEERDRNNKPKRGLLKLASYNSGDHVFIQIQDDGRGINFDKIKEKGISQGLLNKGQQYTEKELLNVMMMPGFSTTDKVTTVSGRGVGMDVVKRDVSALRGDIEISTEKGLGTIFTLRLPLTLTVLDTLVVNVSEEKFLIPINEIEHCFEEKHSQLFSKKSRQINYNGQLTPFVSLRESFGREAYPETETVIVVNKNDTRVAVVVDGILGTYQTVYKPLNELLQPVNCFSGASILGDGSTALILDALKLKN